MDEQVMQRIDALAAKLGVVGEHLWEVLLRQVYVDAVLAMFWIMVTLVAFVWGVRGFRAHRKASGESDIMYDEGAAVWLVALTIIGILGTIILGSGIDTAATAILNPEYAAIQKVLP